MPNENVHPVVIQYDPTAGVFVETAFTNEQADEAVAAEAKAEITNTECEFLNGGPTASRQDDPPQ